MVDGPQSVEIDGNSVPVFTIDFWGDRQLRPERMLTPLQEQCPEALLADHPEALAPWVDGSPMRLVALALSVDGGTGRAADVREKLDGRIPGLAWDAWWKGAPARMRKLPDHFRVARAGRDSEYTLLSSVEAVSALQEVKSGAATERKSATMADWRAWLEAETHQPPPGRFPTTQVAGSLARWPADSIDQALLRVIVSAGEALVSRGLSAQAAEGWLRAVAQASQRRRELGGSDPRGYTAARSGDVLARLARVAGDGPAQDLLLRAGALDDETGSWRRGFLAGMWEAFEGDDARDLYLRSSSRLGRQARTHLARELFLAAFGPEFLLRRHSELDRLLDALPEGDREPLLRQAIASATPDQRDSVLGYVAASRHAEGQDHFKLRLVAALTLGGEHNEFTRQVSKELAAQADFSALGGKAELQKRPPAILEDTFARAEQAIANLARNTEELRQAEAEKLEAERREQERLRQQVRERNAELAAGREESRLGLRQDMLLAVGEVLQSLAQADGEPQKDIADGLALALRAGGAEPFGSPGERVPFDPERHTGHQGAQPSGSVRVLAPGVIYRGGIHGDRVLLKAQVKHEEG